jgi:hypothetical protein
MMRTMPRILLIGACAGGLAIATPAGGQPSSDPVSFNPGGLLPKKPKPGLPDVKAQPLAWPRLDPGAVLCRTEDDLLRLGARRAGETVEGQIDCQIVRAATAITIVHRDGPGRAEVKTSDPKAEPVSGWTDAWLPEKGKVGNTSVSR